MSQSRNNDSPWWVRFAEKFGMPMLMAGFLMWWITNGLDRTVRETQRMLEVHNQLSSYYLRAICVNTAGSDDIRRANCLSIQEPK